MSSSDQADIANVSGPEKPASDFHMDPANLEAELNKVPLFMNDLPDEENETLDALQSLVYDGTPEEIAENFKNQGNECFQAGKLRYNDAITFYTRAIDTDCKDLKLIEACYANRAACNLELENYGRVLRDCAKCLELNPQNVKALYRSARALSQLERLDEAFDCCEHALAVDPANAAVKQLQAKIKARQDTLIRKQEEKDRRVEQENKAKEDMAAALKRRNVHMQVTDQAMADAANIQYDAENDIISWPVFFLYPEHKESDYIQQFDELATFSEQLEVMFSDPAPWDPDHVYNPANLDIYFENNQGLHPTLLKFSPKATLKKVLAQDKYVVTNGVPSFIILPKTGSFKDEFIQKYKKDKA